MVAQWCLRYSAMVCVIHDLDAVHFPPYNAILQPQVARLKVENGVFALLQTKHHGKAGVFFDVDSTDWVHDDAYTGHGASSFVWIISCAAASAAKRAVTL